MQDKRGEMSLEGDVTQRTKAMDFNINNTGTASQLAKALYTEGKFPYSGTSDPQGGSGGDEQSQINPKKNEV